MTAWALDGKATMFRRHDSDTDRRGLPTGVDYHLSGLPSTSTASYDAGGDPTVSLLNRVVNASVSDAAGNLVSDTYTAAAASGRGLGDPANLIVGFTQQHDAWGRVRQQDTNTAGDLPGRRSVAGYDFAGRLTRAFDRVGTTCRVAGYGYARDSSRPTTSIGTVTDTGWKANPVAKCPDPVNPKVTTRVFNAAAQITTGTTNSPTGAGAAERNHGKPVTGSGFAYSYDPLGRVTTIPAGDTPTAAGSSAVSLTYYADDTLASTTVLDPGGETWTVRRYGLDPQGRQNTYTDTVVPVTKAKTAKAALRAAETSTPAVTVTRRYADAGDSPAWVSDTGGTVTQWLPGITGGVAATLTTAPGVNGGEATTTGTVPVTTPHGDTTDTLPLAPDGGNGDGGIDGADLSGWDLYGPYGKPVPGTAGRGGATARAGATGDAGNHYGWLGSARRPTQNVNGLIQMGARAYNPNSGQFLSTDPIPGGNPNPYTYPVDPINQDDTSGMDSEPGVSSQEARILARLPWDQRQLAKAVAGEAWFVSEGRARVTGLNRNALRHITWQLAVASLWGVQFASAWAHAHERATRTRDKATRQGRRDHAADKKNNQVARSIVRRNQFGPYSVNWAFRDLGSSIVIRALNIADAVIRSGAAFCGKNRRCPR